MARPRRSRRARAELETDNPRPRGLGAENRFEHVELPDGSERLTLRGFLNAMDSEGLRFVKVELSLVDGDYMWAAVRPEVRDELLDYYQPDLAQSAHVVNAWLVPVPGARADYTAGRFDIHIGGRQHGDLY